MHVVMLEMLLPFYDMYVQVKKYVILLTRDI